MIYSDLLYSIRNIQVAYTKHNLTYNLLLVETHNVTGRIETQLLQLSSQTGTSPCCLSFVCCIDRLGSRANK